MSNEKPTTVNLDPLGLIQLTHHLGELEHEVTMLRTAVAVYDHALEEVVPDREVRAALVERHADEMLQLLVGATGEKPQDA